MINIQKSYPVSQNQGWHISIHGNGKIYIIHDPSHTHPYIHGSSKLESGLGFGWKFSRFGYEIPRKMPSLILESRTTTSVSLPNNQHSLISAVLIKVNPQFMILRIIPQQNGHRRIYNYPTILKVLHYYTRVHSIEFTLLPLQIFIEHNIKRLVCSRSFSNSRSNEVNFNEVNISMKLTYMT